MDQSPAFQSVSLLIVPASGLPKYDDPLAFHDIDEHGLYFGGQVRLMAAAEFSVRYAPRSIIVVGGMDPKKQFRQTAASKRFILERSPGASVKEINSLPCTRHNVIAIFNQLGARLKDERVGILTNAYHLPRFLAFWSGLKDSYGLDLAPPIEVPAEALYDPGHQPLHTAAYEKRLCAEADGIAHWRAGKYVDSCLNKLTLFRDELNQHPGWYLAPEERTS